MPDDLQQTTSGPATHSPGPWRASDGEIFAADGEIVGTVYRTEAWTSGEPVDTEDKANARLIAAAPDLLAALRFIFDQINLPGVSDHTLGAYRRGNGMAMARDALAKVEGGSA